MGKSIKLLAVAVMCLSPTPSMAGDGIFFPYTTAQRLYIDMETCRQERTLCGESEGLLTGKLKDITLDKDAYRKEAEDYKAAYQKSNDAKIKAETSRPSRLTWFMIGVLVTLGTILGGTIAR